MPLSPIASSCLISLAIGCASNLIAQRLKAYNAGTPFVFDEPLFWRFAVLSVVTTPVNYWWQVWLERNFPGWRPTSGSDKKADISDAEKGTLFKEKEDVDKKHSGSKDKSSSPNNIRVHNRVRDWRNIFCKWFLDCMTLGALINTALFLILMGIMEGKSYAQIETHLRKDMWQIIWDSYKIWPVANFVSTMWCPVEKRIVFLSACGLVWNVYLTLVAARL
ncbi:hypothetical protein DM02DRAFT_611421 [Periconia macrospinosa]|uniref:Integral membrane protein-like protein n=1 Tax=Periconia macrospinosa TaxID=97972 RepID=A0A2V1E236_9PLEO|nr:hypothetical protein DM02DRAFT_611421 [Periconia macrospinosa]